MKNKNIPISATLETSFQNPICHTILSFCGSSTSNYYFVFYQHLDCRKIILCSCINFAKNILKINLYWNSEIYLLVKYKIALVALN